MKSSWQRIIRAVQIVWKLRPYMRGGRHLTAGVLLTSFLSALMEGLGVGLLVPLLTIMVDNGSGEPNATLEFLQKWIPGKDRETYFLLLALAVFGAIVLKNLILYSSQFLAAKLKQRMVYNLRNALFQSLHRAPLSLFEERPAGAISNIFLVETNRTMMIIDCLILMGQRSIMALCYLSALVIISPLLSLVVFALAITIGLSISFLHRKLEKNSKELTESNQALSAHLIESFGGIRLIRTTHSQSAENQRFQDVNHRQTKVTERASKTTSILLPFSEIIAVGGALMILAASYVFLLSKGHMSQPEVLGFGFMLLRLLPLVNHLYTIQGQMLFFSDGVKEVHKWLTSPQFPIKPFGKKVFSHLEDKLEFKDVEFAYSNGKVALQGISLTLPKGSTTALVGASGSGKSTVAALLLRLREPTKGTILVDGEDFWNFSPTSWHKAVGVVEQDSFLFHDTIAMNITFGLDDVSEADIWDALEAAQLKEFVEELPKKLQTVVGERGTMLSGGQKQRLAIARALVRKPSVLILDEATSALDNKSENLVQVALEKAMKNRTVLIIAHRLSTIRHADQILVLDKGLLAERGSWNELVQSNGLFSEFLKSIQMIPQTP